MSQDNPDDLPDQKAKALTLDEMKMRHERRENRLKLAAAILAPLVPILAMVAGYFAYQAAATNASLANAKSDASAAQSSASTLATALSTLQSNQSAANSDLASASAQIDLLGSTVSSLQSENASLSSQLSVALQGIVPTPPSPTTPGSIRENQPLVFKTYMGTQFDLDYNGVGAPANLDVQYVDGGALAVLGKAQMVLLNDGKPAVADYPNCIGAQNYNTGPIVLKDLPAGVGICLRTDESRIVALQLVEADSTVASLGSTVFDPPI